MNLQTRIQAFSKLGKYLEKDVFKFSADQLQLAEIKNPWFTQRNIKKSVNAWHKLLTEENLKSWLLPYSISKLENQKIFLLLWLVISRLLVSMIFFLFLF
jgi:hypothetical protein